VCLRLWQVSGRFHGSWRLNDWKTIGSLSLVGESFLANRGDGVGAAHFRSSRACTDVNTACKWNRRCISEIQEIGAENRLLMIRLTVLILLHSIHATRRFSVSVLGIVEVVKATRKPWTER
jgi:hypothetical protein